MKIKYVLPTAIFSISLFLISWGYTGHRTIGQLTENQLSPTAKAAVKSLLGDTSIADACTWADDARKEAQFKETSNWHFLNLPLGLTFDQFKQQLDTIKQGNVYSALLHAQQRLRDQGTSKQEKVYALKFLMHLVGDLHQPMHVSRAEDKGGNTIQLNYQEKGTNLHSLWDTRMLEQQGLTYLQLASQYNNITAQEIKTWQSDPLVKWVWESYQISSLLYAEVEGMQTRKIDDAYLKKHLPTVEQRIKQAAVRLAGILNQIYSEA